MKPVNSTAGAIPRPSKMADWIKCVSEPSSYERIEAFFCGKGYELHRHDTYAIGRTLAGVQSFHYRGAMRSSLPGATIVLHPDELHDGEAATECGLLYRMVYIEPAAIQRALGGKSLPFIRDGISHDGRLFRAAQTFLKEIDEPIEPLEYDDAVYALAIVMRAVAGGGSAPERAVDYQSAERARGAIRANPRAPVTLGELERVTARDRWSLSRDFRRAFGTSPYRYLVMRRLDLVKDALRAGGSLADAALDAGFSDQAHMTRHFTRSFGMPPARWRKLTAA